jgi:photosystem II stability/assembly factor-like uncharacterized protein
LSGNCDPTRGETERHTMTISHRLYVGTIGEGLWRSLDAGESFTRTCDGMFVECHVRAIAVHPHEPRRLFLGTEQGLFRSDDGADHWEPVPSPMGGLQIWSILIAPAAPDVMLAGTCPARLFRSADAGRTWREAEVRMRPDCPRIIHTRVTSLCGHPGEARTLWAGVEIDGVYRSRDAGESWQRVGTGLSSLDIHALAFVPGSGRLIATTNNDVNTSLDGGGTWQPLELGAKLRIPYFRGLAQRPGLPEALLLGCGDAPPGTTGLVARSTDAGATWHAASMPAPANSTIWNFAVHPAAPELIYASSVSGQLYRSTDGGALWQKLGREFGEIRALAWTP